ATHTHDSPDLYADEDRGRIYRIYGETPLPLPGKIRLGDASDGELVNALASSNILVAAHGSATARRPWKRKGRGAAEETVCDQPVAGRAPARPLDAGRARQARDQSHREGARRSGSGRARKCDPARRAASAGQSRDGRE